MSAEIILDCFPKTSKNFKNEIEFESISPPTLNFDLESNDPIYKKKMESEPVPKLQNVGTPLQIKKKKSVKKFGILPGKEICKELPPIGYDETEFF